MKRFLVLTGFLFFGFSAVAGDHEQMAADAVTAYSEGKYHNAIEIYQKILDGGVESAGLYYNLGNAYFKVNDIPSAILYYEKSLKLRPNDENTHFNLKVAQTRIIDKIDELPQPFYVRLWHGTKLLFPVDTWGVFVVVFLLLTLACAALFLLARRIWLRKLTFWSGVLFILITGLSIVMATSQYRGMQTAREAIIFDPTVNVKSSPDMNSVDIFVIHEGTKVRITDEVGEWNEVRIANGSVGWVKASAMKLI